MNVIYLKSFEKDLVKLTNNADLQQGILKIISEVKSVTVFNEIKNIKKLKGFKNAYRIRVGDYRIGIYFENETIEFARVIHRRDMYKFFP